jgi:hypothetical protein
MLLMMVAIGLALADDPAAAAQRRYPVQTIRITTSSGSFTYYYLPADAPPELRRAYQMLEIAEREADLTERVQRLKAQYVEHEGRLDAARTNRQLFELESFRNNYSSGYRRSSGYRGVQGPGWGYPSSFSYYSTPSSLQVNLSGVIAASGVPERAMQSVDRLAKAQLDLRQTLLDLAAREHAAPPK